MTNITTFYNTIFGLGSSSNSTRTVVARAMHPCITAVLKTYVSTKHISSAEADASSFVMEWYEDSLLVFTRGKVLIFSRGAAFEAATAEVNAYTYTARQNYCQLIHYHCNLKQQQTLEATATGSRNRPELSNSCVPGTLTQF